MGPNAHVPDHALVRRPEHRRQVVVRVDVEVAAHADGRCRPQHPPDPLAQLDRGDGGEVGDAQEGWGQRLVRGLVSGLGRAQMAIASGTPRREVEAVAPVDAHRSPGRAGVEALVGGEVRDEIAGEGDVGARGRRGEPDPPGGRPREDLVAGFGELVAKDVREVTDPHARGVRRGGVEDDRDRVRRALAGELEPFAREIDDAPRLVDVDRRDAQLDHRRQRLRRAVRASSDVVAQDGVEQRGGVAADRDPACGPRGRRHHHHRAEARPQHRHDAHARPVGRRARAEQPRDLAREVRGELGRGRVLRQAGPHGERDVDFPRGAGGRVVGEAEAEHLAGRDRERLAGEAADARDAPGVLARLRRVALRQETERATSGGVVDLERRRACTRRGRLVEDLDPGAERLRLPAVARRRRGFHRAGCASP